VLAVGDTEPRLRTPTFFYQDMGFGAALENFDRFGSNMPNLLKASRRRLNQLASEQAGLYATSTGIFTMGTWFARWLVERGGLPPKKVHAIGGGLNAIPSRQRQVSEGAPRQRLLFVGKDFFRKGGDIVVDAVARLRRAGESFTLSIVGPSRWPLEGALPPWIDFRGSMAPSAIAEMWGQHDLLVVPSWFEAYGLVFLEARAAGLPCVARRAFAMPELVPDGEAGRLVPEHGGSEEVAEAVYAVSTDQEMFEKVNADAARVASENSWSAVASRALNIIERSVLRC
jgi:glycosyltransferase involved in cell wall biosynthesis